MTHYSSDHQALFHHLCGGGEALGVVQVDTLNTGVKKTLSILMTLHRGHLLLEYLDMVDRIGSNDPEAFLDKCASLSLQWIEVPVVTKGPWEEKCETWRCPATDEYESRHEIISGKRTICYFDDHEDHEGDVALIVDAGNTYERLGLFPSSIAAKMEYAISIAEQARVHVHSDMESAFFNLDQEQGKKMQRLIEKIDSLRTKNPDAPDWTCSVCGEQATKAYTVLSLLALCKVVGLHLHLQAKGSEAALTKGASGSDDVEG